MSQVYQTATSSAPGRLPHRLKRRTEERVRVLGGAVDLVKPAEVFHLVDERLAAGERAVIANHNLHSLFLIQKSEQMRRFYAMADVIEVDSTPLIFWARFVGRPSRRFHRCTYLDWRDEFWDRAVAKGWRVFFLGSAPGVPEAASEKIRACWPDVSLKTRHGYFDLDSPENDAIVQEIRAFQPDVLLVGMGMPRQERWILENFGALEPCAVFAVGGAFDYEAGVQRAAPRWAGRIGAEWLFRLLWNPRRLFRRYCIEPWSLVAFAAQDVQRALISRTRPRRDASSAGAAVRWVGQTKA